MGNWVSCGVVDVVINYKEWVSLNLVPRAFPFSPSREKPWERSWGSGLCVSKMADATLSSEDEEIVN